MNVFLVYTADMELDIHTFISEIEKRPAIYNTKLRDYFDKNFKKLLWEEVCEACIINWNELETMNKDKIGQELQKKWQNLRTCFKREYDAQRYAPSEPGSKKRRKYMYFDKLSFLNDNLGSRSIQNTLECSNRSDNDEEISALPSTSTKPATTKKAVKSYEETLIEILNKEKGRDEEIDEDRYFLLSLLPTFKKFNEEQKFQARTEILHVMRQVRLSKENLENEAEIVIPDNSYTTSTAAEHPVSHSFIPE